MPVNETVERIIYEGVDRISGVSRQSADAVKTLRQGLDQVKSSLASLGVAVSAGAMAALYHDTIKAVGALDDMSESTGASVEKLSAIQRVAKVGTHDFEGLTGQIGKMVKGLREGGEEGGRTATALAFLDVKAKDANGRFRDTGQVLIDVARKLAQYEDGGNKVALIQDILGKGAERYLPLLKEIAEGTDLHATTTAKQAQAAEEAEKNIRRLTLAFEDSRKELVNEYTPAISRLFEKLLEARRATGNIIAGGLMAVFSGDDLRAELREVEAELKRIQKNSGVGFDLANIFGMGVPGAVQGMSESRLLQRREFLQRMLERDERNAARAGTTDPNSPLFEFGGQPLEYASTTSKRLSPEEIAKKQAEGQEEFNEYVRKSNAEMAKYQDERQKKELEALKAGQKARLEAIDEEQELEIARGQEIVDADGLSHSLKLEALKRALMTQEEVENANFRLRIEALREFSDEELETLGGYQAVKEKMEAEHQQRLNQTSNRGNRQIFAFVDAARAGDLQSATSHFASLTAGFAQHSRKMFELNKIAALADATVSMAQGISKSLSAYPWPWSAVAAAAHAALFAVQIQAIQGAQFGGGNAAPSVVGGGTPATPVTPVASSAASPAAVPTLTTVLDVGRRQRFDLEDIEQIVELLNEGARKGMRLDRVILRQS